MRRASPSPGTPFSVLTGPTTSGSLPWSRSALRSHLPARRMLDDLRPRLHESGAILRGGVFAPRSSQTQRPGRSCCAAIFFSAPRPQSTCRKNIAVARRNVSRPTNTIHRGPNTDGPCHGLQFPDPLVPERDTALQILRLTYRGGGTMNTTSLKNERPLRLC
jgi:hypothetical protein